MKKLTQTQKNLLLIPGILIAYELCILVLYVGLSLSPIGVFPITIFNVHSFMWSRIEILAVLGCLYIIYVLAIWLEKTLQKLQDGAEHPND